MKQNRTIKTLSTPGTLSIAVLLGLLALLFVTFFSHLIVPDISHSVLYPFRQLAEGVLFPEWETGSMLTVFLVNILAVALLVFLLFRSNEQHSFIRVRTILPCLFFVFLLITSCVPLMFCSGLWGAFALLFALWRLMPAYQEKNPTRNVFDVFFLLAVGSFFSFELLFLIPVFWLSFPFYRITSFRTFMASVIGLIAAYIVLAAILLPLGALPDFWDSVRQQFEIPVSFSGISPYLIVYLVFLFLFFLLSFFSFFLRMNEDKIRVKQTLFFFFLLTFSLFVISVIRIQVFSQSFPLLALMLSITTGRYFALNESRISLFLFIFFVLVGAVFFVLNG